MSCSCYEDDGGPYGKTHIVECDECRREREENDNAPE
jgi:hypothetical protein